MTALLLSIRAPKSDTRTVGEIASRTFFGAFGGLVIPAAPAAVAREHRGLLAGERWLSDLSATVFEGSPITSEMIAGYSSPSPVAVHWCAVGVALPRKGRLERQPWLRFGPDPSMERGAVPLATTTVQKGALQLRFGLAGAPFVPPPSRDRGGLIDQVWAEAADFALAELGLALRRLAEDGLETELRLEGVGDAAVTRIERTLRGTPKLVIEASPELLAVLSERPGRCIACRHANQGTFDLQAEGLLACTLVGSKRGQLDAECNAKVEDGGETFYAYEPWDGANTTWATTRHLRFQRPR